MLRRLFLATILLILAVGTVFAQQRTGTAYCDLDHLYDTIPSPFYDDDDHTPRGKLRWDTDCHVDCGSSQ